MLATVKVDFQLKFRNVHIGGRLHLMQAAWQCLCLSVTVYTERLWVKSTKILRSGWISQTSKQSL